MKNFQLHDPKIAHPFSIEDDYFKKFPLSVIALIKERNGNLQDDTTSFENTDTQIFNLLEPKILLPYQVPESYFKNLSAELLTQVKHTQASKIYFLTPYKKFVNIAAVFTLIALSIGYFIVQKNQTINIPKMDDSQIISALQNIDPKELYTHLNDYESNIYNDNNELNGINVSNEDAIYANTLQLLLND